MNSFMGRATRTRLPVFTARSSISSITHNAKLNMNAPLTLDRKTKIICTVGPSTWSPEGIRALLLHGMNVMRLNFSHGTYEQKSSAISNLRLEIETFRKAGPIDFTDGSREDFCAVAADTKGPEIRTGTYEEGESIDLISGDTLILTTNSELKGQGSQHQIYVDYSNLANEIAVGQQIFLDDGLISLTVKGTTASEIICEIMNGGPLGTHKGVNIPAPFVSNLPSITDQDWHDLRFCAENKVDIVFASFVRKAADIWAVRGALGEASTRIKIIAKIENQEGIENFDEILEAADGIMVARGDLGIEIPAEKVFVAQKMMIAKCNLAGKPVICATQMLESMVVNPRPTRAECGDVANAVLDGADAVMLSGETAKGKWPIEAVDVMSEICKEAEGVVDKVKQFNTLREALSHEQFEKKIVSKYAAVACSAVTAAFESDAIAIVVLTRGGFTARSVAKFRPACPIVAVTDSEEVANQIMLHRGIIPLLLPTEQLLGEPTAAIEFAANMLSEMGLMSEKHRSKPILAVMEQRNVLSNGSTLRTPHLIFV